MGKAKRGETTFIFNILLKRQFSYRVFSRTVYR